MAPNTPAAGVTPPFSAAALALIIDCEGLDQPGRWPGEDSGISLGHGYDLSCESADELRRDWTPLLGAAAVARLTAAAGKSGPSAAALAPRLRDITVTREQADAVFTGATLPKYAQMTRLVYPRVGELPLDAQGALVSLVYNRGTSLGKPGTSSWASRQEMRAIQAILADGVQAGDLAAVAAQLRAMKRLWQGRGMDGLVTRRESEAKLVEQAA